jgi:hypothetical protein
MRFPLSLAGKWHTLLMKQMPYQEGIAEIKTETVMSFFTQLRIIIFEKHSKLSFLVDSRATLSVLLCCSSAALLGPKLIGANGASIPP